MYLISVYNTLSFYNLSCGVVPPGFSGPPIGERVRARGRWARYGGREGAYRQNYFSELETLKLKININKSKD